MRRSKTVPNRTDIKRRPALNPEDRENQIIAAAMDLVEERILNGTASSQEVTHFLKLGSEKERLEREKLKYENEKLKAQTDSIRSQQHNDELLSKAMAAFAIYSGNNVESTDDEDEEDEYSYS